MGAIGDLLWTLAQRSAIGAGTGAAAAGVESQGDPSAMETGAITGGIAGGATTGLGLGASGASKVIGMAPFLRSPANRAKAMILRRMKMDDITPEELAARADQGRPGVTPLFLHGGRNMLSLAEIANLQPGPGRNVVDDYFANNYLKNQRDRVQNSVHFNMGADPHATRTVQALQAVKQAEAKPLYDKAYSDLPDFHDDEMDDILGRAEQLGAFGRMKTIQTADKDVPQDLPRSVTMQDGTKIYRLGTQHADLVKRGLDSIINDHTDDMTGRMDDIGRAVTGLKKRFTTRMDELNPAYGAARKVWSDHTTSQNAVDMGVKFLNTPPDQMDHWLEKFDHLSDGDQDFFRTGVATAIRNRMQGGAAGQDAVKTFFKNNGTRDKLRAIFPDQSSFDKFANDMDEELKIAGAKNYITGNSRTAGRQLEQSQLDPQDMNLIGDIAHLTQGNFMPIVHNIWTRMRTVGISPETAHEVLKTLFETDPGHMKALANDLGAASRRMRTIQRGKTAIGSTVAGGAGALAGVDTGQDFTGGPGDDSTVSRDDPVDIDSIPGVQ